MKKAMLIGLTAAIFSPAVMASEVDGFEPFAPNTNATAQSVNDNFQALITAINDNAQRIEALEEQSSAWSVAGSYQFLEIAIELAADSGSGLADGYSEISSFSSTGTFTFDEGGSFSATINERISTLRDERKCDFPGTEDEQCRFAYDPDFDDTASEGLTGSWSENSNNVTLDLGDEIVTLFKAAPGLLVLQQKTVEPGGSGIGFDFTNLAFLIKQQD